MMIKLNWKYCVPLEIKPFAGAPDTFNFIIAVNRGFVKCFVVFSYELAEGIYARKASLPEGKLAYDEEKNHSMDKYFIISFSYSALSKYNQEI